jgi:hypothetical protein
MPDYRIYIVGSNGHFSDVVTLESADDSEATRQAEQLVDGRAIELWQRARKIATFDASRKSSSK